MSRILLHAPLAGWAAPLDEVLDPVFAQGMMGEGLAIDPVEGVLRAPCDAEVIAVPASAHAITLRLANGAELLIHIGIDTVGLGGDGFEAKVTAGERVRTGDPMIVFDLERVGRAAKSLITPIVVTGEGFGVEWLALGRAVAAGDPIAAVEGGETAVAAAAEGPAETAVVEIAAPLGLHARPAARVAAVARTFPAALELEVRGKRASLRSPVALMALGLVRGDRAVLHARGPDAAAAIAALAPLLASDFGETAPTPLSVPPAPAAEEKADRLTGVCAAPGLAVGPAALLAFEPPPVAEAGAGVDEERAKLAKARAAVAAQLGAAGATGEGIAAAHLALLDDEALLAGAEAGIAAGRSAAAAWRDATAAAAAELRATGNFLLAERVDDLEDISHQLLAELAGAGAGRVRDFPDGAILVADNLLPSQLLALDLGRVGGLCTARGGPTSHAAILAAAAGVPMLVAAGAGALEIDAGTEVVLDASGGWIDPAPNSAALASARAEVDRRRARAAADATAAAEPCRMADGTRIEIFANLASAAEAARALAAGAEGCGLLRTEFLFHDRDEPPPEEEQATACAEVARALGGRPLIVRTLDAGGDKPLPYLALPPEDNPALGLRGVRIGLARPDLLATQLRAILRAAADGDVRIMVPMVVDVEELRFVRRLLEEAATDLGVATVPLGVMVETPAAALLAASLAVEADFLSIGTNDLSQYALAADRGNPATAARIDALHPAVLRLIAAVGDGAARHGKWFGICGGVASDPLAAAILIGLGATELSATPAAIPALKAVVRGLDMAGCRALAAAALEAGTAAEVRTLAAAGPASIKGAA